LVKLARKVWASGTRATSATTSNDGSNSHHARRLAPNQLAVHHRQRNWRRLRLRGSLNAHERVTSTRSSADC
jgi:hypothetical protein